MEVEEETGRPGYQLDLARAMMEQVWSHLPDSGWPSSETMLCATLSPVVVCVWSGGMMMMVVGRKKKDDDDESN
jgi:hypothetical protein